LNNSKPILRWQAESNEQLPLLPNPGHACREFTSPTPSPPSGLPKSAERPALYRFGQYRKAAGKPDSASCSIALDLSGILKLGPERLAFVPIGQRLISHICVEAALRWESGLDWLCLERQAVSI
jgi:hypothetical protein